VLDSHTGYERDYRPGAVYGKYFGTPEVMFPVWRQSSVLPKKERIFALQNGGDAKAYPLAALGRAGGVINDAVGGEPVVIVYREDVGRVALPADWQKALREIAAKAGQNGGGTEYANDLKLEAAGTVLKKQPKLVSELSEEMLLAMPTETRLALLEKKTPDTARKGHTDGRLPGPEEIFSLRERNEVAERGLEGETRAYERGGHTFRPAGVAGELIDEHGRVWKAGEDGLEGQAGEKLERAGGHLAYWFGWFAFFPETKVYGQP
jgi:hypothetical protein